MKYRDLAQITFAQKDQYFMSKHNVNGSKISFYKTDNPNITFILTNGQLEVVEKIDEMQYLINGKELVKVKSAFTPKPKAWEPGGQRVGRGSTKEVRKEILSLSR